MCRCTNFRCPKPELTTIRQPVAEMLRTAVELLVREIKDRKNGKSGAPQRMVLDFDLVRRH